MYPAGNPKIASEQSLWLDTPPEGVPMTGTGCVKINYRFEPGWKFVCLAPGGGIDIPFPGQP